MTSIEQQPVTAYKGFGLDWKCRDHQFKIGENYHLDGDIKACERGFHACEHPLDVFNYYPPASSRYAIVEQSGQISRHDGDTKVASSRIHVKAEISFAGLIQAAVDWTFSRATKEDGAHTDSDQASASATGNYGAASATGYYGAASATGYYGAASATGNCGAASATGYYGAASATGNCGAASATGNCGAASATGNRGAAMASGRDGRAMGVEGCAMFLAERDAEWKIVAVWAGIAGRDGIKADTWYRLVDGKPVEVSA